MLYPEFLPRAFSPLDMEYTGEFQVGEPISGSNLAEVVWLWRIRHVGIGPVPPDIYSRGPPDPDEEEERYLHEAESTVRDSGPDDLGSTRSRIKTGSGGPLESVMALGDPPGRTTFLTAIQIKG